MGSTGVGWTMSGIVTTAMRWSAAAGEVCFYAGTGFQGASWCYHPGGYADVPGFLTDRARSFESNSDVTVYAIDFAAGHCYYRQPRRRPRPRLGLGQQD
jgi:hypothetical protein